MVAVRLETAVSIELHNESILHHSFCDFERRLPDGSVEFAKRVLLAPNERKSIPLNVGTVYITPGRGVVIHGL